MAVARQPASIVLAVDMSGSMAADDVRPTRLAAAEDAIRAFVSGLPKRDRVGLVTFSSSASVAAPLTQDREMVLDALEFATAPGQGTAIGDAIARSVEVLEPAGSGPSPGSASGTADDDPPPLAILLLSDGAQTRGRLSPLAGAARARDRHIPVYSVALGTRRGTIAAGVISLPGAAGPADATGDRAFHGSGLLRSRQRAPSARRVRGRRLPPPHHARVA